MEVDVNGGENGVDNSKLRVEGNTLQASGAANIATSTIDFSADTTGAAAAGILSRQGNSGNVTGTNSESIGQPRRGCG